MAKHGPRDKVTYDEQTDEHDGIDDAVRIFATPERVTDERGGSTDTACDFKQRLPSEMPPNRRRNCRIALVLTVIKIRIHWSLLSGAGQKRLTARRSGRLSPLQDD